MKISLIGYMGSGKTVTAKLLSDHLDLPFFDLDVEIEKTENQPVKEIFNSKGEIYFRKRENQILQEIVNKSKYVLSTGGGTPAYFNNTEILKANSAVIFLQLSPLQLRERLMKEKAQRPLIAHIQEDELTEFIAKHLFERNAYYSQADFTVNAGVKTPENIANEIMVNIIPLLRQTQT